MSGRQLYPSEVWHDSYTEYIRLITSFVPVGCVSFFAPNSEGRAWQGPSQRCIVVAPLAGAMQKMQLARTSSVSDDGDPYAP